MKKTILVIALLSALTACASSGVKVDQSKVAQFQKGKTTYAEVIETLGRPTQSMLLDDGSMIVSYTYASVQARPETFIPLVGPFVGGADTEHTVASFSFNKKGVLTKYTSIQGGMGTGRNLEGLSQERKEVREVK